VKISPDTRVSQSWVVAFSEAQCLLMDSYCMAQGSRRAQVIPKMLSANPQVSWADVQKVPHGQ
jgi:hypothetical protein